MSHARRGCYGPPWLNPLCYAPSWWPAECGHWSGNFVSAFFDGDICNTVDELTPGCDKTVYLITVGDVVVRAYTTEYFDDSYGALWLDPEALQAKAGARETRVHVVGSSGDSCFVTHEARREMKAFSTGRFVVLNRSTSSAVPRFRMCKEVGLGVELLRSENLVRLSMMCRLRYPKLVLVVALTLYDLVLSKRGNCVFAMFRRCSNADGKSLGL